MSLKNRIRQYVFLQGGLGNQLYMLAYADYLKKQGYTNVKMLTLPLKENRGDTKDKKKRFLLTNIPKKLGIDVTSFLNRYIYSLIIRLPKIPMYKNLWSKFIKLHIEPQNEWAVFHPKIQKLGFINIHIGYYQAHQYISNGFREQLKAVFNTIQIEKTYPITKQDVAVHIRRGDFLTNGNNNIFNKIELPHYLEGLQTISENVNIGKIYIFSDDFDAIAEDINIIKKQYKIELVEGQSVLEDFVMLQQFSNFVIGNSTFSWWAAILSDATNVVVPKKPWKIEVENLSPYLDHWILI
jgi:putative glycosyltransferase